MITELEPLAGSGANHRAQPVNASRSPDDCGGADTQPRLLKRDFHGFNLVGYRGHVYALAVSLGPVDLGLVTPAQLQAWQQQGLCLMASNLPPTQPAASSGPTSQAPPNPSADDGSRMFSREKCLRYDGGEADRKILQALLEAFCPAGTSAALCGLTPLATYFLRICPELRTRICCVLADEDAPSVSSLEGLPVVSLRRLPDGIRSVFIAHTQWRHLERISGLLPRRVQLFGLDSIVRLNRALVGSHAWVPKQTNIYPIQIPEIEIRTGLDMLLMDLPARSIAQMPAGLAYVHNALKLEGIQFQTLDCDVILYHRFHSHRVLDGLLEVRTAGGHLLPEDPWQPAHYLQWESDEFLEYFRDDLDEISRKLIEAAPKVLGLSLQQANLKVSARVIRALKQALPDTVVIVGGMSCLQPEAARMIMPEADYVVVGEADLIIGPLVQAVLRGERLANLPGVWSRWDAEGRSFVPGPLPMDLDHLEPPRYEWINIQLYRNWNGYQLTPVVGSRGCHWARCTFCAERFKWRSRDPIKIVDELEWLHGQGFTNLVFNESDFHGVPELVRRMAEEIIRRGLKLTITAQLRCHKAVDLDYFRTLQRAGVRCLRFGIDGGSANILKLEKKGYTKEMIRRNLRDSTEAGIYNEVNLVVGVPGETEADVDETIEFLTELQPHIGRLAFINPLMMFRGSDYWNHPEKHAVHFHSDREKLRQSYPVAIPDPEWHSEEPYIDHQVRYARVNRIIEALRASGMPLGDYAVRTADRLAREAKAPETSPNPSQPEPVGGPVQS